MGVFQIPSWYIPSRSEIVLLRLCIENESTEDEAKWARFLDCSAFCNEDERFFYSEIEPVYSACCKTKLSVIRIE